jgi:hypothetical protein
MLKQHIEYRLGKSSDEFQSDLNALAQWRCVWQLNIAVNKTFMLYIRLHNKKRNYTLNGINIMAQDVIKDLCIYISADLSWHVHCVEIAKKANAVAK